MPSDPFILGFDTSAAHCAAALLCGDRVVIERKEDMARGQAERLMPFLEEILAEAQVGWSDLAAIGVGIGPGNFTGIRISVAAARGLGLGLGVPIVGVSALEALAFGASQPVRTLVPAPRDCVYMQAFGGEAEATPQHMPIADLQEDGIPYIAEKALVPSVQPPQELPHVAIPKIAATRYLHRPARPVPLYIKPADAAPSRVEAPAILT